MKITAMLLLLALTASCDLVTGPDIRFPADRLTQFTPPAKFRAWWAMVEECSGKHGDFDKMRWYHTNRSEITVKDQTYTGIWFEQGNRIALADEGGQTVRHEMLHALLRDGNHPLPYFDGYCRGVVVFDQSETFGAPPSSDATPTVNASSVLSVSIAPIPAAPSSSQYGGWFAIEVRATNITNAPVWVALPGPFISTATAVDSALGTGVVTTAKRVYFRAGETRRVVIDFGAESAGTLLVSARYGYAFSQPTAIVVVP